ncbi:MAG: hypothetical protein AB8G05_16885 [Oligoflexales bacterium]
MVKFVFFLGLINLLACGQKTENQRELVNNAKTDGNMVSIELASDSLLGEGQGDCDDSSQCKSGLSCVNKKTGKIESFKKKIKGHETCELTSKNENDSPTPNTKSTKSPSKNGSKSNFQVELDGEWTGISCSGSRATIGDDSARWIEHHRYLIDIEHKRILDCPERRRKECDCNVLPNNLFNRLIDNRRSVKDRDLRPYGEAFHGHPNGPVSSSIDREEGDGIFPDIGRANCVFITNSGKLSVQKTNGKRVTNGQWSDNDRCPYFKFD